MFEFLFKKRKKKISLVLSGGGAKGFFHLGVINAIRDCDIEVEEISGTSIGAIMGTIYASNPDVDFDTLLDGINLTKFLGLILNLNNNKAIKKIEDLFAQYINVSKFSDLKIPMSFNATDISNGEEIVFRKGDIFPGLFASMAIPFVFPLVEIDGRYLCDGGVVNNLPLSLIKKNRKNMVASLLGAQLPGIKNMKDRISVLSNAYYIMEKNNTEKSINIARQEKDVDLKIVRLNKFMSTFDFRRSNIKSLMDIGYKEAMKILK